MAAPDLDIVLDGTHFRLKGPLAYTNLATLPPKVVVGDYSLDTNELMSSWAISDLSGGHGVSELTDADTNRFRWNQGIYTRFPGQWTMPYRIWSTNEDAGQYQPMCDGLTRQAGKSGYDWRHFSLVSRTIYIDHVSTGKTAGAKATNKGVVYQGNGNRPLLFIPHGAEGYTIYDPLNNDVFVFTAPTFVAFALLDDKLIGIDTDGVLYKSVRSSDELTAAMTTSQTFFKADAPDVKYSKTVDIQIGTEQMTITAIDKANQKVTVTRAQNGTSVATHAKDAEIYGVWYRYGGKCRMPRGTDIRDLIVFFDRDGTPAVHIVTDRDVWALDDGGPRVFPTSLTFPQGPYSGVGTAVWRGDLYVSGGMDIYRYNGDVVSNIGLSRDDGLPRNYQGAVIDLAAGPNGLYALVKGRTMVAATLDYWSVHEWNGSGWQTIWAESRDWLTTTLGASVNDSSTELTLASNDKLEYGDRIKIDSERLFVDGRVKGSGTKINVRRGRHRTTAASHSNGATVSIQQLPSFIQVSLAEPDRFRVYWGIGRTRFYQEQPAEATNPREDVENNSEIGFGRAKKNNSNETVYPTGNTYILMTGRYDGGMAGYVKIANAVELRLRRLPANQILRLYYRLDHSASWKKMGTVAGVDQSKLDGLITDSVTTFTLDNVKFIRPDMVLTVENEQMLVTAWDKSARTVTVTRGYNGTTAAGHANNRTVYVDFKIGTVQNSRQLFRFGPYATNYKVFAGKPFHLIEFKLEVKDERGDVYFNAALASDLGSGVVTTSKTAEDDDLIADPVVTATPADDTFVIEHLSFSYLKLRAPSGSWVADLDLSEPWMDQSPQDLINKLEDLLATQKFLAFQHRDKTYRVRLAQVTGADNLGNDERASRRINIIEMPVTLGPLGDW